MKAVVGSNELLPDVALTFLGDVSGIFDLCAANGLMPDADLVTGQELKVPAVRDQDVVDYFLGKSYRVATGTGNALPNDGGIEFNEDFNEDWR